MQESTAKIQVEGIQFLLFVHDKKKYVIPNWMEVPMDTTYDDIELISPLKKDKNKTVEEVKKENSEFLRVEIPSSTGKGSYWVQKHAGTWSCTCPANMYRRMECKHIKQVKS